MVKDLSGYKNIYTIRHDGKILIKSGKDTILRSQNFSKGMMRNFYHAVILIDDGGNKKVFRINDLLLDNFDRKDITFVYSNWNLDHVF